MNIAQLTLCCRNLPGGWLPVIQPHMEDTAGSLKVTHSLLYESAHGGGHSVSTAKGDRHTDEDHLPDMAAGASKDLMPAPN